MGLSISRMGTGPVPVGVVSLRFVPPLKKEGYGDDQALLSN